MALYTKATDTISDYLISDKTAFKESKLSQINPQLMYGAKMYHPTCIYFHPSTISCSLTVIITISYIYIIESFFLEPSFDYTFAVKAR